MAAQTDSMVIVPATPCNALRSPLAHLRQHVARLLGPAADLMHSAMALL